MDFQELGLTLKQERERQGLTIEVVMDATKISRTNIVAMENGDRSTLPHPVYAKGFIKSYARYLGLDADELSMVVDREYQDEADGPEEHIYEVSPAAERAFQEGDSPEAKGRSLWPLLLILIVLVAGGVYLFISMNNGESPEKSTPQSTQQSAKEQDQPPLPEIEAEQQVSEKSDAPAEDAVVDAPEIASDDGVEGAPHAMDEDSGVDEALVQGGDTAAQPVPQDESEPVPESKPQGNEAVKPAEQEEQAVENKPQKQKYDHVVIIRATTDKGCWIGLWKGNETKMARDFVLKQGEPLRLMFNTPRRIRIGNVAGVTVTYNGQPYELDGGRTNIQTLKIGF